MTFSSNIHFRAIPLGFLATPGEHRIQNAVFFKKRLYVGVISHPVDATTTSIARLLRYYPGAERWEAVYEAVVEKSSVLSATRPFPLELGWRALSIMPIDGGTEALCATLLSLRNAQLIYSTDGEHFEALPAVDVKQPRAAPFGLLHPFQSWLFATPVGAMSDGLYMRENGHASLYVTRNPRTGDWQPANAPGFGNPGNEVVHGLIDFHGWLYAAVGNPFAGFQLWRTQAVGPPPFTWELALDTGARRYTLNPSVASMAIFQDALYLGTGVPETELLSDEVAGAEIIRIFPDNRWELVMGKPRFSPIGLQVPLSANSPGFDDSQNTLVAALASSNDVLYAAVVQRSQREITGFQIRQTVDGENWQQLHSPAFLNPCAYSLRVLLAMPNFLLAGGVWKFEATTPDPEPSLWCFS
ncbi:MAG: hypothetical protein H6974_00655 [Gammaproteobacteria bacterium]|nr:hypothetical protein [Gammaproteobacteria bacterium]MCP5195305.1 hypothetical protein [Gammaproteobacteria bacterium]